MSNIVTSKRTIYRKDTKPYNFILKRKKTPIDLSGKTVYFSAKTEADGTSLFDKACSNTTPTEGLCQVTLSSVDTAVTCINGLAEVVIVSGSQHETLGQFFIDIVPDVKMP
jgi:hypothetical protein